MESYVYVGYSSYPYEGCSMPEKVFVQEEDAIEWSKKYPERAYIKLKIN